MSFNFNSHDYFINSRYFWPVENYRRANPTIGVFHVVRLLFKSPDEEPVLLSRLSQLKVNEEEKCLEAEIYDELEVELDRLKLYDDLEGLSRANTIRNSTSGRAYECYSGFSGQKSENENFVDLSLGSGDLSQSYMSRSIFSFSLFSGERSRGNASRSLGGGPRLSNDELKN